MDTVGYAFFPTTLGICGIMWGEGGIRRIDLPEDEPEALRARFRHLYPDYVEQAPPHRMQVVIDAVVDHLKTGVGDLSRFDIDLDGVADFERHVYEEVRKIPAGRTRTYGDLARAVDAPGSAQAVGQALAANPVALLVPCHRVVAAGGKIGGFSAGGGADTKRIILRIEGSEMGIIQDTLFEA